jgi:hypothetical protein
MTFRNTSEWLQGTDQIDKMLEKEEETGPLLLYDAQMKRRRRRKEIHCKSHDQL